MAQLKVTLKKSLIGQQWRARRTVTGLGFTKVNQSRILPDNPSVRGMIHKVKHLVVAEPVTEETQG
jgi:large subunit ribosomal protein L30